MTQKIEIKKIINTYDIVKVISSILKVKKSGSGFFTTCPFHNEKTASFYISKNNQRFYCFGCHKTGNIINFIMEYKKCNFITAIKIILKDNLEKTFIFSDEKNELFEYFNTLLVHNKKSITYKFLASRGINDITASKFKLGIMPANLLKVKNKNTKDFFLKIGILDKNRINVNSILKNRLIIPIRNIKGDYIGIGGRTIYENFKPKYINSPDSNFFSKKNTLYGIYEARKNVENLIIVEGYFDVIKLHQFNITNVVALLGTAFSKSHLFILKSLCKKLIFCFDGDKAGQLASIRSAFMCLPFLFDFKSIKFVSMPNNSDPDSFLTLNGKYKFLELLNKSISLIDFIFLSINIKLTDFNFFFKLNKILAYIENFFVKNFIIYYLSNLFYFNLNKINVVKDAVSIFMKACIFLLKKRYLINKIDLKKITSNRNVFFNSDLRIFLDLCFLIKNNFYIRFSNINKRLIKKIKIKCSNIIMLTNRIPSQVLENEFLSILKKIESYDLR